MLDMFDRHNGEGTGHHLRTPLPPRIFDREFSPRIVNRDALPDAGDITQPIESGVLARSGGGDAGLPHRRLNIAFETGVLPLKFIALATDVKGQQATENKHLVFQKFAFEFQI